MRSEALSLYALFVRWVVTIHLLALAAQLVSEISFAGGCTAAGIAHIYSARLIAAFGLLQAGVISSLPGMGADVDVGVLRTGMAAARARLERTPTRTGARVERPCGLG